MSNSVQLYPNIALAQSSFSFPFSYLEAVDITAYVDGVVVFENNASTGTAVGGNTYVVAFSAPNSTILTFSPAVVAGSDVRIQRNTDLTTKAVDFADGAVLTELALDTAIDQVFFGAQEAVDKANDSITVDVDDKWNAQNKPIKNVGNPTNAQDVATKNYLENTWLTPSDKAQLNSLNLSNLNTVATDVTNVNTTATNITDVNTVATDINDVNTLAGISQAVTDVAAIDTEIDVLVNKYDGSTTATSGINKNIALVEAVADNATNINTVASAATDIGLLADLQDGTTASGALSNLAIRSADIEIVAHLEDGTTATNGISNLAARATDIQTVAARDTDIGTLADLQDGTTATNALSNLGAQSTKLDAIHDDLAEIVAVHGSLTNIDTLAPRSGDLAQLGARATDIATLADVQDGTTATNALSNLGSLGNQLINLGSSTTSNHINTLGPLSTEIGEVAAIDTQVSQVAGIRFQVANIDSRKTQLVDAADSIYNKINQLTTVYNNMSDINSVADNISGITSFAEAYFSGATAPTGAAINAGDLWYDTSTTTMKVYNGSIWEVIATNVNGTAQRVNYTATAGQTTFAATYDVGFVDVYLNGVKLVVSTDFTATNGTSIVLTSGAAVNDTVDIIGYGVFDVANVNFSINDATDVNTAGVTDGQVLAFNSSTSDFEPVDANAGAALLSGANFSGPVSLPYPTISHASEIYRNYTTTSGDITAQLGGNVHYCTADQTANRTFNNKYLAFLPNSGAGDVSSTAAVLLTNGATPYVIDNVKVEYSSFTSTIDLKWEGGAAPTAGNANSVDLYTFTFIRTGDKAYTCFASQPVKFA